MDMTKEHLALGPIRRPNCERRKALLLSFAEEPLRHFYLLIFQVVNMPDVVNASNAHAR